MYSSLCDGVLLSPFCNSPRNNTIQKITIHHMAGIMSGKRCAEYEQTSNNSANYCIGIDGDIWCAVDESDRAWTSSSPWNDNQAITMELSNDGGADTDWHVSNETLEACINLCVDICKRYDFTLEWTGDEDGSLTVHQFYAATACPGPYLMDLMPWIAEEVNRRIDNDKEPEETKEGWFNEDGWVYYEDNKKVTHDFREDSKGDLYFLDDDGNMATNKWVSWKNRWRYVGADGKLYTDGWYCVDGTWYIFDKDGYALYSQWYHNASGTWSYLDENCKAVTGWRELEWDGQVDWYYFDNEGTMMTDTWNNDYFVCNSGKMLKSTWVGHNDKYYWVGSNGKWENRPAWTHEGYPDDNYPVYEY